MNTTTPLKKGGFMLLVHPKDPKVLLISPELWARTVYGDLSFQDSRQWFRSLRRLFPRGRTDMWVYWAKNKQRMSGRTRSPEYVKQLRKRGYAHGRRV